jgi:predicted deacetylase
MLGDLLTVALKRSGRLLTISAFAIMFADSGNAADLKLWINPTPSSMAEFEQFLVARHMETVSPAARQRLFQEFLRWSRPHH